MHHPDLKKLLWGGHLQKLLAGCGVQPRHTEPAPRIGPSVPLWFQRLGAALTVLGLVGAVRVVDKLAAGGEQGLAQQAEVAALDAAAWNKWAEGLNLRLNPFALRQSGVSTLADTDPVEGLTSSEENDAVASLGPDAAAAVPEGLIRTVSLDKPARKGSPSSALLQNSERPATPLVFSAGKAKSQPVRPHRFKRILVTAYSSRIEETDDTPRVTASNTLPAPGTIALSRDLLRTFTPGAPFDFGEKVLIPGVGVFEVRDTMHPRWSEKADIWLETVDQARTWGRRTVFVTGVEDDAPTTAFRLH